MIFQAIEANNGRAWGCEMANLGHDRWTARAILFAGVAALVACGSSKTATKAEAAPEAPAKAAKTDGKTATKASPLVATGVQADVAPGLKAAGMTGAAAKGADAGEKDASKDADEAAVAATGAAAKGADAGDQAPAAADPAPAKTGDDKPTKAADDKSKAKVGKAKGAKAKAASGKAAKAKAAKAKAVKTAKASAAKAKAAKAKAAAAAKKAKADAAAAKAKAANAKADAAAAKAKAAKAKAAKPKADPAVVAKLWKKKCKKCHGIDGRPKASMAKKKKIADMTTAAWQKRFSDKQLRSVTLKGFKRVRDGVKQRMPGLKGQPPEVVDGLVRFMRKLKR